MLIHHCNIPNTRSRSPHARLLFRPHRTVRLWSCRRDQWDEYFERGDVSASISAQLLYTSHSILAEAGPVLYQHMSFSGTPSHEHISNVERVTDSKSIMAPWVQSIYLTFRVLQLHSDKDWDDTFRKLPGLREITMHADDHGEVAAEDSLQDSLQDSSVESAAADHAIRQLPGSSLRAAERAVDIKGTVWASGKKVCSSRSITPKRLS